MLPYYFLYFVFNQQLYFLFTKLFAFTLEAVYLQFVFSTKIVLDIRVLMLLTCFQTRIQFIVFQMLSFHIKSDIFLIRLFDENYFRPQRIIASKLLFREEFNLLYSKWFYFTLKVVRFFDVYYFIHSIDVFSKSLWVFYIQYSFNVKYNYNSLLSLYKLFANSSFRRNLFVISNSFVFFILFIIF